MPKRLKFVVAQRVLFIVRRQTWQAQRFEIFEWARHFRIKSNWDVRFEFAGLYFDAKHLTNVYRYGHTIEGE